MTPRLLARISYAIALICAMTIIPSDGTFGIVLKSAELLCLGIVGVFIWD
jgi:hypothetical protein